MSEKKRYYWLKLPNTYFSQLEQKKMRKQEHGKDMQIIYLRMMLYSLGRNGCIYYQNVYDTIEEELAEEFDEDVELIKETVKYLLDNNMISVEDSNISIPEVDRITGSECYSAERMRRMREKKKASQCDSGVTVSDDSVTGCDEENRDEILDTRNESVECKVKEKDNASVPDGTKKAPDKTKKEASELFEKVWALYPSKKGKGQVSDTQKKKLLKIGEEELTRAIERYKADLSRDEWRKPQNGSTFFNSGYVDYLDENWQAGADSSDTEDDAAAWERARAEMERLASIGPRVDGPF